VFPLNIGTQICAQSKQQSHLNQASTCQAYEPQHHLTTNATSSYSAAPQSYVNHSLNGNFQYSPIYYPRLINASPGHQVEQFPFATANTDQYHTNESTPFYANFQGQQLNHAHTSSLESHVQQQLDLTQPTGSLNNTADHFFLHNSTLPNYEYKQNTCSQQTNATLLDQQHYLTNFNYYNSQQQCHPTVQKRASHNQLKDHRQAPYSTVRPSKRTAINNNTNQLAPSLSPTNFGFGTLPISPVYSANNSSNGSASVGSNSSSNGSVSNQAKLDFNEQSSDDSLNSTNDAFAQANNHATQLTNTTPTVSSTSSIPSAATTSILPSTMAANVNVNLSYTGTYNHLANASSKNESGYCSQSPSGIGLILESTHNEPDSYS
jgi:hypothetical protein